MFIPFPLTKIHCSHWVLGTQELPLEKRGADLSPSTFLCKCRLEASGAAQ